VSIKAKKSLGQNFLIDNNIIRKIVDSTHIEKDSNILEIGPGTGNLTNFIIKKKPKKIYVIEKDKYLSKILENKFNNKIQIINKDVLKIDNEFLNKEKLIIFGNLPYNISTQILVNLISLKEKILPYECLILMFQKEVALRLLAKKNTKEYGRLSIITNWKLEIEKIMDVSPNCFFPKPKVTSTLLKLTPKKDFYDIKDIKNLEMITKIFFNQRRKKIKKSFYKLFKNRYDIEKKLKLDLNFRPQNLSQEQYYEMTKEYENLIN